VSTGGALGYTRRQNDVSTPASVHESAAAASSIAPGPEKVCPSARVVIVRAPVIAFASEKVCPSARVVIARAPATAPDPEKVCPSAKVVIVRALATAPEKVGPSAKVVRAPGTAGPTATA